MKTITQQQARELTATKIMGWVLPHNEWLGGFEYYADPDNPTKCCCYVKDWNPLAPEKLHQCEQLVAKLTGNGWRFNSCFMSHWSVWIDNYTDKEARCNNKSLAHAIVSAVLQAVDGKQYQIED